MRRRNGFLIMGSIIAVAVAGVGCGTEVAATTEETPTTAVPTTPTFPTAPTTPTTPTVPTVPDPTGSTPTTFAPPPPPPTVPTTPTVATPPPPPRPRPTRPAHLRPGVRVVSPQRYVRDSVQSLRALRSFSTTLSNTNSASQFRANLTSLRRDLRNFDGTIRRLRSYQLLDPRLDRQRRRLGQEGPPLARTMSDFLDAVRDGNPTRARTLASQVQTRLDRFRRAGQAR